MARGRRAAALVGRLPRGVDKRCAWWLSRGESCRQNFVLDELTRTPTRAVSSRPRARPPRPPASQRLPNCTKRVSKPSRAGNGKNMACSKYACYLYGLTLPPDRTVISRTRLSFVISIQIFVQMMECKRQSLSTLNTRACKFLDRTFALNPKYDLCSAMGLALSVLEKQYCSSTLNMILNFEYTFNTRSV
ncbi:hypothetical protein EVAR_70798_1 [Eumeta japonica]|uniref:Uncharacterized protein n=1 Tax=Eumeta variegata TaxID=151549 RepID=A0A4C1SJL5_EUMVA|nr:hypothetical protein EVAR_70798_1 [Eumeta japonica]